MPFFSRVFINFFAFVAIGGRGEMKSVPRRESRGRLSVFVFAFFTALPLADQPPQDNGNNDQREGGKTDQRQKRSV